MKLTKLERRYVIADIKLGGLFEYEGKLYMLIEDKVQYREQNYSGVLLESGIIFGFQPSTVVEPYQLKEIIYQ